MNVIREEKESKYIHVKWNGWDWISSFIKDDEELEIWLNDGSLEKDDLIYEIASMKVVKAGRNKKLRLRDLDNKEHVRFT